MRWQCLDGHFALQLLVKCAVHDAHTAATDLAIEAKLSLDGVTESVGGLVVGACHQSLRGWLVNCLDCTRTNLLPCGSPLPPAREQ